jgi:hypothetical protein
MVPNQQDRNFMDRVSEVEHGARPPKRDIAKRPRIGPMVSARGHMEAGPERGANAHRITNDSCLRGKDRGRLF